MALDRAGRRPRDPAPAQRLAGCGCHGDGDAAPSFFFGTRFAGRVGRSQRTPWAPREKRNLTRLGLGPRPVSVSAAPLVSMRAHGNEYWCSFPRQKMQTASCVQAVPELNLFNTWPKVFSPWKPAGACELSLANTHVLFLLRIK